MCYLLFFVLILLSNRSLSSSSLSSSLCFLVVVVVAVDLTIALESSYLNLKQWPKSLEKYFIQKKPMGKKSCVSCYRKKCQTLTGSRINWRDFRFIVCSSNYSELNLVHFFTRHTQKMYFSDVIVRVSVWIVFVLRILCLLSCLWKRENTKKQCVRGKLMLILFPVSYYLLLIFRSSLIPDNMCVCVNRGKQRIKSLFLFSDK